MKTNFQSALEFSQFGWDQKKKGKRKVASGPGSSNESSKFTKKLILETITEYNIKSILDLGCGDWTWMSKIRNSFNDVSYEGWDASTTMIDTLNKTYGNKNTKFKSKDIVTNRYPKVDLIICRDVLFHLDESLTLKILKKIKTPYLISTSHLDVKENTNIKKYNHIDDWGFYNINLNIEPFNMGARMLKSYVDHGKRSICLYGPS